MVPSLRTPWLVVALGVAACAQPTEDEVVALCEPVCDELVDTCALASYPDHDSCMGGCAFLAQEEADLQGYATCVRAADCDLFEIIECEHVHGID